MEGARHDDRVDDVKTAAGQNTKKGLDTASDLGHRAEPVWPFSSKVLEVDSAMGVLKTFLDGLRKHVELSGHKKQINNYTDGLITNAEIYSDSCDAMVKCMMCVLAKEHTCCTQMGFNIYSEHEL